MALVKPEKKLNWNLNQQSTVRISYVCVRICTQMQYTQYSKDQF